MFIPLALLFTVMDGTDYDEENNLDYVPKLPLSTLCKNIHCATTIAMIAFEGYLIWKLVCSR